MFGRQQIKAIKAKEDKGPLSAMTKQQEQLAQKILKNTNAEVAIIGKFMEGKMTGDEFRDKLIPIETKRIGNALEYSGIKVEKPKES